MKVGMTCRSVRLMIVSKASLQIADLIAGKRMKMIILVRIVIIIFFLSRNFQNVINEHTTGPPSFVSFLREFLYENINKNL